MHSRTAKNVVMFRQLKENGFQYPWAGFNKMVLYELTMFYKSVNYLDGFESAVEKFTRFPLDIGSENESLVELLFHSAFRKRIRSIANETKVDLLMEMFRIYGSGTFTSLPTFIEVVHDLFDISAEDCENAEASSALMTKLLLKIAEQGSYINNEQEQTYGFIIYLINRKRVDLNAMSESEFNQLIEQCFKYSLPYFCSVFSTPTTSVFLHVTLNPAKMKLLWQFVLENVMFWISEKEIELVRLFLRSGCDADSALFLTIIDPWVHDGDSPRNFSYLLELLEIYMDNGARLNPLPDSQEEPFLQKVVIVHSVIDGEPPELLSFIKLCVERGVDPKLTGCFNKEREDLLMTVCHYYNADDLSEVIEYLCNCGAHSSLYANDGAGIWSGLFSDCSRRKLTLAYFNQAILTLMERRIRTNYIDSSGNNLLHLFAYWDSNDFRGGCCRHGWLRELSESKYWDVLHNFLDAGVKASQINDCGETPLHVILNSLLRCKKFLSEATCPMCSRDLFGKKRSKLDGFSRVGQFSDPLKFIDRLLVSVPKSNVEIWRKYERFPVLIRSHFRGEEQSALIQVFSQNGVNVFTPVSAKATDST